MVSKLLTLALSTSFNVRVKISDTIWCEYLTKWIQLLYHMSVYKFTFKCQKTFTISSDDLER